MGALAVPIEETKLADASKIVPIKPSVITEAQRIAIEMLCQGAQTHEIAKAVGVDRKSVQNWKKKPAFCVALKEYQKNTLQARNADMPAPDKSAKPRIKISGPVSLELLDAEAIKTLLESIQLGNGKVALEYAKARNIILPDAEDTSAVPITIQFGTLAVDDEEVADMTRAELPASPSLEPTFKPKV
jgi:hypothetical protein